MCSPNWNNETNYTIIINSTTTAQGFPQNKNTGLLQIKGSADVNATVEEHADNYHKHKLMRSTISTDVQIYLVGSIQRKKE